MAYIKTYSEVSTYPATSETLRQQFKEQLGFTITSINSQDIIEAVNLFTDDLFLICERGGKELVDLFNLDNHSSKATLHSFSNHILNSSNSIRYVSLEIQFLHNTFPPNPSYARATTDSCTQTLGSSILKRDQLAQHISNLIQIATGLPKHLIYRHLSISAVRWEYGTVFVNLSLSAVLGCLAVKGFTFSPKWNVQAYDNLFKRALLTTSCKHDQKDERINHLANIQNFSTGTKRKYATPKLSLPIQNSERVYTCRKRSQSLLESKNSVNLLSTPDYSVDELSNFSKKNLSILQENGTGSTYQNPQAGSNMALIGMMEMLGFSVIGEPLRIKGTLLATLSLEKGTAMKFKMKFDQSCKTEIPQRKMSSV